MSLFWSMLYRIGYTPWEGGEAPPLRKLVEVDRPPGRALDLGCGAGQHSVYLAQHGWEVTGVEAVPRALRTARQRATAAGVSVTFLRGDVARMEDLPLSGPYDLVLDVGCFHALTTAGRRGYAAQVQRLTTPGSTLLMDAVSPRRGVGPRGIDETELRGHFDGWDVLDAEEQPPISTGPVRGARFTWYHLRRSG